MSKRADKKALNSLTSSEEIREALRNLFHRLQLVTDLRSPINQVYPSSLILMLLIIGLLIGKNDPTNISLFLGEVWEQKRIQRLIGYHGSIPSKQVFLRQLAITPPMSLMTVIDEWTRKYFPSESDQIALDGKAIRAALEKVKDEHHPPYMLNAVAVGTGVFVMNEKVGEKTNEAASLPGFAAGLELQDKIVTIDAAGTHSDIASVILTSNGHFCLPVKDNQKTLNRQIESAFRSVVSDARIKIDTFDDDHTDQKAHGRFERRVSYTMPVMEGTPLYKFIQNSSFRDMVCTVGKIQRYREVERRNASGEIISEQTVQELYYITDIPDMSAEKLNEVTRSHWIIERCHYVTDMVLEEDRSTIRTGYAMENMSLLRKVAINILTMFRRVLRTGTERLSFQHTRAKLLVNLILLRDILKPYSKRQQKIILNC